LPEVLILNKVSLTSAKPSVLDNVHCCKPRSHLSMTTVQFLCGLPPLLGLTGFVIHLGTKHWRRPNPLVQQVLDKITMVTEFDPVKYKDLTPARAKDLLETDKELRNRVGENQFGVLRSVLRGEFVRDMVLYLLWAILFFGGIIAFLYTIGKATPEQRRFGPDEKIPAKIQTAQERFARSGNPSEIEEEWLDWLRDGLKPPRELGMVLVFESEPLIQQLDPFVAFIKFEEDDKYALLKGVAFIVSAKDESTQLRSYRRLNLSIEPSAQNRNKITVPAHAGTDTLLVLVRIEMREKEPLPVEVPKYRVSLRAVP
jgi:hypothetical protein